MTYNDWRDELKNNLLSVSESERKRVLDYYAEAYADRREAGFSEREIINEFGAPYDAAQRILNENDEDLNVKAESDYVDGATQRVNDVSDTKRRNNGSSDKSSQASSATSTKKREDYTWLFVLLCIVCAGPLFGVIMSLVGITIGLCVAPFSLLVSGVGVIATGIATLFVNVAEGFAAIGCGVLLVGISIILFPLFIKLIKLMWKLFKLIFNWIKGLFSGKERAK